MGSLSHYSQHFLHLRWLSRNIFQWCRFFLVEFIRKLKTTINPLHLPSAAPPMAPPSPGIPGKNWVQVGCTTNSHPWRISSPVVPVTSTSSSKSSHHSLTTWCCFESMRTNQIQSTNSTHWNFTRKVGSWITTPEYFIQKPKILFQIISLPVKKGRLWYREPTRTQLGLHCSCHVHPLSNQAVETPKEMDVICVYTYVCVYIYRVYICLENRYLHTYVSMYTSKIASQYPTFLLFPRTTNSSSEHQLHVYWDTSVYKNF